MLTSVLLPICGLQALRSWLSHAISLVGRSLAPMMRSFSLPALASRPSTPFLTRCICAVIFLGQSNAFICFGVIALQMFQWDDP
uniref:Predicted protein n=1 Tax=Hordeum vulgare subsp. vulgare TaxID=112509 RepID=F2CVT9_HORVV|nr:predicted protein [Hordeum vulgare subsp. vulgare]